MSFDKVVWKEGMLLKPQHFQQNDRHIDYQLRARTHLLSRYGWGLFSLSINNQLLDSSKLSIVSAAGVLPDGTLFEIDSRSPLQILDIAPHTHNTPVYLGLPVLTGTHKETRDPKNKEAVTRYVSSMETLLDANTDGQSDCPSLCAKHDFRLLLGDQSDDNHFVKLKLGQLVANGSGDGVKLDQQFIPTYVHFNANEGLKTLARQVAAVLANRGDKIAERMRSKGQVGGAEVGDFMMLQTINRYEARLQHALVTARIHPEDVYQILLELLAELTTFATDAKRPDKGLRYDHADQSGCFRIVSEAIGQLLGMVLEQHAIELPIVPGQYGVLGAAVTDKSLFDTSTFVLVASAQCDTELLRGRLPTHLKVGSVESIRKMVDLHLQGLKVIPLPVAPRQLPYHANKAYFGIELSEQDKAELKRSGGFGFHLSEAFNDLKLALWAIKG